MEVEGDVLSMSSFKTASSTLDVHEDLSPVSDGDANFHTQNDDNDDSMMDHCHHLEYTAIKFPHVKRRKKLTDPVDRKDKGISLWSLIKDNIGKDLTRICLPVHFNEPLSSLQKCFEEFEYSHLLDRAYECGKMVHVIQI